MPAGLNDFTHAGVGCLTMVEYVGTEMVVRFVEEARKGNHFLSIYLGDVSGARRRKQLGAVRVDTCDSNVGM